MQRKFYDLTQLERAAMINDRQQELAMLQAKRRIAEIRHNAIMEEFRVIHETISEMMTIHFQLMGQIALGGLNGKK